MLNTEQNKKETAVTEKAVTAAVEVSKEQNAAEAVETTEVKDAAEIAEVTEEKEAAEAARVSAGTDTAAADEAPAPVQEEQRNTGYQSAFNGAIVEFELQYRDQETDLEDITKRAVEDYAKRGNDASAVSLVQIYLKPTDFTAYYVINNSYEGKVPLF